MAFCNGKLYGLSYGDLLYKLTIGLNDDNAPVVISIDKLTIQQPEMYDKYYLFELCGKLTIAIEGKPVSSNNAQTFRVFELSRSDATHTYNNTWAEVTSLGDHALFLGPGCCKAVCVSARGMHHEVERNHIYYSKKQYYPDDHKDLKGLTRVDLGSCTVYCYESEVVHHSEKIMSRGYHYRQKDDGIDGRMSCTWILPPHF
jgi:hypothetical protein